MSGKIAFLFPGQGSQYSGMGRDLCDAMPVAREVFAVADAVLGFPLGALCFEGKEAELAMTVNTQPAVLATSVAALTALRSFGVEADYLAGHSLGEYSALVAAGTLTLTDAIDVVRKRGRYMQEAVPVGIGAMAAILGLESAEVENVCLEAARGEIVVAANYNSPEQTVIAGHGDAVRRAVALAEARGARKAVMLPVSAPFHSPLMAPAATRLTVDLERISFSDPTIPLVANVDAGIVQTGAAAREAVKRQVTSPVRWTDCLRRLSSEGVSTFVEVGPGKVLLGLVRRMDRSLTLLNVEDMKSLEAAAAVLGSRR